MAYVEFFAPKGQPYESPGQRPGLRREYRPQALKGRNHIVPPLQGLGFYRQSKPRALPWAGIFGPFRAEQLQAAKVLRKMKDRYLEATYRKGKLLAAYLYLPRQEDDKNVRVQEFPGGLLVDVTTNGRPIGIELIAPADVTLNQINAALDSFGPEHLTADELSPLHQAA